MFFFFSTSRKFREIFRATASDYAPTSCTLVRRFTLLYEGRLKKNLSIIHEQQWVDMSRWKHVGAAVSDSSTAANGYFSRLVSAR